MKFKTKAGYKVLIAGILIGAVFVFLRFLKIDFSAVKEEEFKAWVESLGVWGPFFYVMAYLLRPLILFPAGVLSASAGFIWGPVRGFFYVQIAANVSAWAEFLIARYFARGAVENHLKGKTAGLDKKIGDHGFMAVLLVRLIPNVAWDIQNLSLGLTKIKFRDYVAATLIGIIPGSFAFVFFGASLIKTLFNPKSFWIIIVSVIIIAAIAWLQRHLSAKRQQAKAGKRGEEL